MIEGTYGFVFCSVNGFGMRVFTIKGERFIGVDSSGVNYDGTAKEQEDWGSAKSTRRAFIAKDYRLLLLVGDNLGDFTDAYKGSIEERQKVFDDNAQHWGKDWIAIPNPTYGSWESAAYAHDFKTPPEEQRQKKLDALKAWSGPAQ